MPIELLWVVLLTPLAAAGTIWCVLSRSPRAAAAVSIGAVALSFAITVGFLLDGLGSPDGFPAEETSVKWVSVPPVEIGFGIMLDSLSILLSLIVTGVGGAIHVYSLGYMKGQSGTPRYFGSLSLFTTSMLGIVFSTNFIQIFIFWELVGLCSYLLIGFWFERPAAADAGKKAFLVNRLGDVGFLLGILLLYFGAGGTSFDFSALREQLASNPIDPGVATWAALLIFCGAIGKSAQFPLHVWLPDAMEGPTPVSALIHAATMVAAGIYLIARVFFVFEAAPVALSVVAIVGVGTAFLAATMALVQTDLKRVLAYSTISQLGFMMLALGLGGYTAAIFHLTTHAFFKALLFLCAGSVIHALHTQEIYEMGGLFKRMKITSWTFVVGAVALAGVPGSWGFFSKEEILVVAWEASPALFAVAVMTAGITALYVGRVFLVAFTGPSRGPEATGESPKVMTVPLIFLAVLCVPVGYLSLGGGLSSFLEGGAALEKTTPHVVVAVISSAAAILGLSLAWALYGRGTAAAADLAARLRPAHTLALRKYYLDDLYLWIVRVVNDGSARLSFAADRYIVMGLFVNGAAALVRGLGKLARVFQTGRVRTYGTYFLLGLGLLLYLILRTR